MQRLERIGREREPSNEHNRYAVASKNDGVIIGHSPRRISRSCSLFLRRGSSIAYQQSLRKINVLFFRSKKISCVKFLARLCQTKFLLRRIFLDLRYAIAAR